MENPATTINNQVDPNSPGANCRNEDVNFSGS
jgi:hypothetical protein